MNYIIYLISFLSFTFSFGQLSISYKLGLATSNHKELREIFDDIEANTPFELQRVNNFGPASYQQIELAVKFAKSHQLRGLFSWTATGGKTGARDDSGNYFFQQSVKLRSIGLGYQFFLLHNLSIGARYGITRIQSSVQERLDLFDEEVFSDEIALKSKGTELVPSLTYYFELLDKLSIPIECGYSFDSSRTFRRDGQEIEIKPNWSGWRMAVGITYSL